MQEITICEETIKQKIFTIKGVQVMLDSDLAKLYGVSTGRLNEQMKRNIDRFPIDFMFQLTPKELKILISQFAISSNNCLKSQFTTSNWGGRRKLPLVFTEQGVAMLSSVLKSRKAIEVNIQIIRVFISMRKFISKNAEIFNRLDNAERKQVEYEIKTGKNFEKVFNAIEDKSIQKSKGLFFEGQVFDAYNFISDLIRGAKKSILLIDNYVDDSVLTLFSKRERNVKVIIYTSFSKQLELDLAKFNSQYEKIEIKYFNKAHDRFMIIDEKEVYHIGASLKDLGKKWFAFSKFNKEAIQILSRL